MHQEERREEDMGPHQRTDNLVDLEVLHHPLRKGLHRVLILGERWTIVSYSLILILPFLIRLWSWFSSVDTDRSGAITAPELGALMG